MRNQKSAIGKSVKVTEDLPGYGTPGKPDSKEECELRLRHVTQDLRALESITEVALSTLELKDLLNVLVERVVEVAGADSSMILLIDESTDEVVPQASYHIEREAWGEFRVKSGQGLSGKVIAAKRPVVIRNAEADPSVATPYIRRRHIKSIIGVPLRVKEKVIGVGYLYTLQEREFTPEEVRRLEVMADRAAMAINNAILFDRVEESAKRLAEQTERFQSLLEGARDISSNLEIGTLLRRIVERGVEIIEAEAGMVGMLENGRIVTKEWWNGREWIAFEHSWREGEGSAGWVWRTQQPYLTNDATHDPHASPRIVKLLGLRNFICVPLLTRRGGFLGIVEIDNKRGGMAFTKSDLDLMQAYAQQAAVAIQNARLIHAEQRRARELDAVIENMTEGVSIASPEGRILRINRLGREILGIEPFQRKNQREEYGLLEDYFKALNLRYRDGREVPPEERPFSKALRGETFVDMEVIFTRPDGHRVNLLFGGSPVRDEAGNIILAVVVWRDITAFRELERRREELVNIVAHDIRTPVSVIMGQAQLIQRFAEDTDSVRKRAEAIVISTRRMNTMISDLVDSARMEAGQMHLNKQPVNLKAFISDLLERSAGVMDTGRIRMDIPPDIPPLNADPDRLERVFTNLLGNALKYSPAKTEVLIRARKVNGEALVSVSDRGVGIAPEDIGHIFEAFYRGKGARGTEGLGLGLYITKMLVEAHGGRIWVESQPGVGTTFYFTVPFVT